MRTNPAKALLLLLVLVMGIAGCASTGRDPRDPFEPYNRRVQQFNDKADVYFLKPVAKAYQWITPEFLDRGVSSFYRNVDDINVVLNDVLQGKFKQGGRDTLRFLINSTLGVGGFFDVATEMGLPKNDEDFGQTLVAWGLPRGPYLVLPLRGPSTPTSIAGDIFRSAVNPINYIDEDYPTGSAILSSVDLRADNISATNIVDQASLDRYEFIRNAWFQRRRFLEYDGNPPLEDIDNGYLDLDEEGVEPAGPSESNAPAL